jgi:hypothetical protein
MLATLAALFTMLFTSAHVRVSIAMLQFSAKQCELVWFRPMAAARVSPLADDAVIKKIPLQCFPRDLFMLGRTIMLLRGLAHALDLDIQVPPSACMEALGIALSPLT